MDFIDVWNKLLEVTQVGQVGLVFVLIELGSIGVVMLLEIALLGVKNSSLYRLVFKRTTSARIDLWSFFFVVFGLQRAFSLLYSLGLFYLVNVLLYRTIGPLGLLSGIENAYLQFIVLFILADFKNYIFHVLVHKKPFWALHKFHHSATEFNVITTVRGHFLQDSIGTVVSSLFFLVLGGSAVDFIAVKVMLSINAYLHHSNVNMNYGIIGKYILLSPNHHKVHHSTEKRHHDSNYGSFLIWWDLMFSTYRKPEKKVNLGISDKRYNKVGFWQDLKLGIFDFIRDVFSMFQFQKSKKTT